MTQRNDAGSSPVQRTEILVLNHHRDVLEPTLEELRRHGFGVTETQSIIETHRVLTRGLRPALIVLNPLVLQPGSVELELLEDLQRDDDPVPVIMLVDSPDATYAAARSQLFPADFMVKPHSTDELLHRIELKLVTRDRLLALHRRAQELEEQVLEDFKTGLINDRHFKSILVVEWKRAQRHHTPLSLLLLDVDDFKHVNDSTEYSFGDEVLAHVAGCLKKTIRATDYAARFGGDEFALLLPHTTPEEAVQTANRVKAACSGMQVESGSYSMKVTVSIGIGTYDGRSRSTVEELRREANKALHRAKTQGKDCVDLYSDSAGDSSRPAAPATGR